MSNSVAQAEIARYVEAVRAALSDLPARERDELLEDLPDHLAEVAAEGQGSLEARLGSPEAYALELRASAGLGGAPGRDRIIARASAAVEQVRRRLRQLDVKLGPLLGYATAGEFLRQLRPAWWVLRGYIIAMVVTWLLNDGSNELGLLPRLGGSDAAAMVILCAFIVGSIWLGRRSGRFGRWPRRLVGVGGALAVLFAMVAFVDADQRARWNQEPLSTVYSNPYQDIGDVFVYDAEGRLLTNVRLFDQNGQPIQLGYMQCEPIPGVPVWQVPPYPRCPENAPFGIHPSTGSPASPSAIPASPVTPATPSASPDRGASAPATAPPAPAAGRTGTPSPTAREGG